jgi:hypothetical protein
VFIPLPNQKESQPQDIETSISSKDKVTSRVSSEPSFTIPEEDVPSSKSTSETLINTSITLNISSLLKEPTQVNTCSAVEKQPLPLVMSFQSTESHKVPPFATSNLPLVIKDHTQDAQELTPPLLDTLTMAAKPESDSHQVPEKPFQAFAEPQLVSSPVEVETKSQS